MTEGETLAVLERERAEAAYEESLVKLTAQKAGLIRARAEIGGHEPKFGEAFDEFPDAVVKEKPLLTTGVVTVVCACVYVCMCVCVCVFVSLFLLFVFCHLSFVFWSFVIGYVCFL